jgi:tRNA pseudouridine38-40 synthase
MRTVKATIAYDGGPFVGWQRQARGVSIQGLIEAAFTRLTGAETVVTGAGRTDAGVHALGQVASVRIAGALAIEELWRGLNALLPAEVRIVALEEAPADFHARYGARRKRYAYRVTRSPVLSPFTRRYAWHVTHPLDVDAMTGALGALLGTHDFAAFQATGSRVRETVRTLSEVWLGAGEPPALAIRGPHGPSALGVAWDGDQALTLLLTGDGFLRHMVRTIAGTLVEIGRGRWPPAYMADLLASRDRRRAGPTAPPHGLFLVDVEY